jgi:Kef-type K+ transport system membrane component KefB
MCAGDLPAICLYSIHANVPVCWIALGITVSDLASFALVLGLGFAGLIPLHLLTGTAGQSTSTLLIVAIATAVCSIPVISCIFWDLGIMRTRFVRLILGYALLEDLAYGSC